MRPRLVAPKLLRALESAPVVLVHGPRQCGKTTLTRMVCEPDDPLVKKLRASAVAYPKTANKYTYLSFDNPETLTFALDDPLGFIDELPNYVILDEIQRVPKLIEVIKLQVDRFDRPGQFLLTGSANILQLPRVTESLAGRMQPVLLRSFAQAELVDPSRQAPASAGFLSKLFGDGFQIRTTARLGTALIDKIVAGGYPRALATDDPEQSATWYRHYANALAHQDLLDVSRIRAPDVFSRTFSAAATQTAGLFNVASLSASFELSRQTISSYVRWLERLFLIDRLPAWQNNRLKRLVKTPKLHVCDTGLAAAVLNVDQTALSRDRELRGQFVESFVYQELRKQASWLSMHLNFYHFRDKEHAEVDVVLENSSGQVAGIEVKAGATVHKKDFRGLRKLADAVGHRFVRGVVLYDGEQCLPAGKGLYAVPIRHLWES